MRDQLPPSSMKSRRHAVDDDGTYLLESAAHGEAGRITVAAAVERRGDRADVDLVLGP
jgi:hypothetical protein